MPNRVLRLLDSLIRLIKNSGAISSVHHGKAAFGSAASRWIAKAPSSKGETALKTQFVEVQPDVKVEVLDWGGTGGNLVLLAGLGRTAHVFDSLGSKLAAHYHVIEITRRGFGQSSAPQTGYDPRPLGDDVVAVLDALQIADPVLVGHSIAGEELSAVSTYHPGRAALIYLDATGTFALFNPKYGDATALICRPSTRPCAAACLERLVSKNVGRQVQPERRSEPSRTVHERQARPDDRHQDWRHNPGPGLRCCHRGRSGEP